MDFGSGDLELQEVSEHWAVTEEVVEPDEVNEEVAEPNEVTKDVSEWEELFVNEFKDMLQ